MLQQAEQADPADEDPQKLPEAIARRQALLKKMQQACARLEARAQARAEAERAGCRRQRGQRRAREGNAPSADFKPPPGRPAPEDQINLTDPEARRMRKSQREGYRARVTTRGEVEAEGSQWIVGQRVSDRASDAGQWEPDGQSIPREPGQPTAVLADCGSADKEDFGRLQRQRPELELWASVYREEARVQWRYDYRLLDKLKSPPRLRDPVWVGRAEKLKSPGGSSA